MNVIEQRELISLTRYQRKLGWECFRRYAIRHLKFAATCQEEHEQSLLALEANHADPGCESTFAVCAAKQVTIYNMCYMASRMRTVAVYGNTKAEGGDGGDLTACAWISASLLYHDQDELGDALLAVASTGGTINIISIAQARVVAQMQGVAGPVQQLESSPDNPRILASLAANGKTQIWDVQSESCVCSLLTDATCMVLLPGGQHLLTGSKRGQLHMWALPPEGSSGSAIAERGQEVQWDSWPHKAGLDCLKLLRQQGRLVLVSKSEEGVLASWDPQTGRRLLCLRVPHGNRGAVCRVGHTHDGMYMCVGNGQGDTYVYDALDGSLVTHLRPRKFSVPVRACHMLEDGRALVSTLAQGYFLRYELDLLRPSRDKASFEDASEDESDDEVAEMQPEGHRSREATSLADDCSEQTNGGAQLQYEPPDDMEP